MFPQGFALGYYILPGWGKLQIETHLASFMMLTFLRA